MMIRILLVVPTALLVWWFSNRLVRPDEVNWIVWVMTSDSSMTSKTIWGLICFAGTVFIVASLALFARRSVWSFAALMAIAYGFANVIGIGYLSTAGSPMEVHDFVTLALGMTSSVPMVFSDMIAGKQIDVVGDEQ